MKSPTEAELLSFLSGELEDEGRLRVLESVENDPEVATRLRAAARGLAEIQGVGTAWVGTPSPEAPDAGRRRRRGVPTWALPLTAAATLALAVPITLALAPDGRLSGPEAPTAQGSPIESAPPSGSAFAGAPESPEPSFVLVLQGRWPDAATVDEAERVRRAEEYWAWTSELAERGLLLAAGDLRWEPGLRVEGVDAWDERGPETLGEPGFLVGMFALRTDSYEEALALAQECPHLRYGGSIAVRRVGGGFVTVPGMGDWSD